MVCRLTRLDRLCTLDWGSNGTNKQKKKEKEKKKQSLSLLETRVLHIDFPAAYREIEREERGEREKRKKKKLAGVGRMQSICASAVHFFLAHVTRAISYIHN